MAGYQFIHVECYARSVAAKSRTKARTAQEIIDEAARRAGACPHVDDPQAPTILYGCTPDEVLDLANERANQAVDIKGRKLRKDAPILVAGVASFPHTWDEVRTNPEVAELYATWRDRNVEALRARYADDLKSVLEHTDEKHPHIHFLAVPELTPQGTFPVKRLIPGHAAAEGIKDPKEQRQAYTAAMRDFQDWYWEEVGGPVGMARIGPGRRRLSRAAWRAEQDALTTSAKVLSKADELLRIESQLEARARLLEERERGLEGREIALRNAETGLEAKIAALAERATEIDAKASGLADFEASVGQREAAARRKEAELRARERENSVIAGELRAERDRLRGLAGRLDDMLRWMQETCSWLQQQVETLVDPAKTIAATSARIAEAAIAKVQRFREDLRELGDDNDDGSTPPAPR